MPILQLVSPYFARIDLLNEFQSKRGLRVFMYKLSVVASTVAAFSLSSPVNALPVDALDLLSSFNVITLGDLNTGVHTEGTAYIGGDLNLTGSYDVNTDRLSDGQAGDVSGALIVGGDINGNSTINFVNGDVVVGGDINVAINRADSITSGADVPAADVAAELLGLSSLLSELPDTDGTSINRDQNDQNILFQRHQFGYYDNRQHCRS